MFVRQPLFDANDDTFYTCADTEYRTRLFLKSFLGGTQGLYS